MKGTLDLWMATFPWKFIIFLFIMDKQYHVENMRLFALLVFKLLNLQMYLKFCKWRNVSHFLGTHPWSLGVRRDIVWKFMPHIYCQKFNTLVKVNQHLPEYDTNSLLRNTDVHVQKEDCRFMAGTLLHFENKINWKTREYQNQSRSQPMRPRGRDERKQVHVTHTCT